MHVFLLLFALITTVGFNVGIRIDPGDPHIIPFWNAHARSGDSVHTFIGNAQELDRTVSLDRSVTVGYLSDMKAAISDAKAHHIPTIFFNDELPETCAQLANDERLAFIQIHQAGLKLLFAPTGYKLTLCPPATFIHNLDRLMFQTEFLEGKPNYVSIVHNELAILHKLNPTLSIGVQVSTSPASNPKYTAKQVLSDIHAIQSGAYQGAIIYIFYRPLGIDPSREGVMEQVVKVLRP